VLTEAEGRSVYLWWTFVASPYESYTTRLFSQAVKQGGTVLDLGAHYGYYTFLAAAKVGKAGTVYALEPAPTNFSVLSRGIELNRFDNVYPVMKAASDKSSLVTLFISEASTGHGMYGDLLSPIKDVVQVDSVTVDEFLAGQGVDVVKMDIEGHEPYALQGMTRTIERSPRLVMFVEWTPALLVRAGVQPAHVLVLLRALGFDVRLIDEERGALIDIDPDNLPETSDDPLWHRNLYCVRPVGSGIVPC